MLSTTGRYELLTRVGSGVSQPHFRGVLRIHQGAVEGRHWNDVSERDRAAVPPTLVGARLPADVPARHGDAASARG